MSQPKVRDLRRDLDVVKRIVESRMSPGDTKILIGAAIHQAYPTLVWERVGPGSRDWWQAIDRVLQR